MTKRYELDFRERAGRMGYKVQTSVKNFQMTLEVTFHLSGSYVSEITAVIRYMKLCLAGKREADSVAAW